MLFAQCFIRCYLKALGILTEDDKVNKEVALARNWATSGETVDECLEEMGKGYSLRK